MMKMNLCFCFLLTTVNYSDQWKRRDGDGDGERHRGISVISVKARILLGTFYSVYLESWVKPESFFDFYYYLSRLFSN